jgi:ribosome-associated protein
MARIAPDVDIDENELREHFVRASGPGGQNVNKVATAVQLQFDLARSSLPPSVLERLHRLAGSHVSVDGILTIEARRHRTREQNRDDARARLIDFVRRASKPPKPRRATKPTRASREKRLEIKKRAGQVKRLRRSPAERE